MTRSIYDTGVVTENWSSTFLQRLVGEDLNNVAIITHGGFIRITVAGILKLDQTRRFYLGSPLKNCSITSIRYSKEDKEFYIQSFNDHAHLEYMEQK